MKRIFSVHSLQKVSKSTSLLLFPLMWMYLVLKNSYVIYSILHEIYFGFNSCLCIERMRNNGSHYWYHSLASLTILSMKVSLVFFDFLLDICTFNVLLNVNSVFVPYFGLSRLINSCVDHWLRVGRLLIRSEIFLLPYHGQVVSPDVVSSFCFQFFLWLPFLNKN